MHEFENCIVENENGAGIAVGYVMRCNQDIITVSLNGNYRLRKRQPVCILVHSLTNGESRYEAEVISIDSELVDFVIRRFTGATDRRQCQRIPLHLKERIYYRLQEDKKQKLSEPFDITILNLGANGMLFNSAVRLEEGFIFPMRFTESPKPVELVVQVLRREEFQRNNDYGCVFRNISKKEQARLEYFILREQIRSRRDALL